MLVNKTRCLIVRYRISSLKLNINRHAMAPLVEEEGHWTKFFSIHIVGDCLNSRHILFVASINIYDFCR